jgi:hypothetical protein
MFAKYATSIPVKQSDIPAWRRSTFQQLSTVQEMINQHYGIPGAIDTGQTVQPTRTTPFIPSPTPAGGPIQKQLPPSTGTIDTDPNSPTYGQPKLLGPQQPQMPVGAVQQPGGIPGQIQPNAAPIVPNRVRTSPVLPVAPAPTANDRVSQGFGAIGPATGLPPGAAEAKQVTGKTSGEQLAADRIGATTYQREVFPLEQAIPALEKLGTKGTGPGTETFNHIKSFILSNVPGVKETDFNGTVGDYDKAKKYLTDFVNQTGTTGTNDKLAAAFAGNPSVGISNAAAQDVAKSALALRRMKQAQIIEFGKLGIPDDQYAKWATTWNNTQDARAYGFDLMSPDKQQKLLKSMTAPQKQVFLNSLRIAHDAGLTNPIAPH